MKSKKILAGNNTKSSGDGNVIPRNVTYPVTNNTVKIENGKRIITAKDLADIEAAKDFVDRQNKR